MNQIADFLKLSFPWFERLNKRLVFICTRHDATGRDVVKNVQFAWVLGEEKNIGTMLTVCLVFSEMKFAVVIVLSVCVVLAMARPGLDLEKLSAQCSLSVLCFQR